MLSEAKHLPVRGTDSLRAGRSFACAPLRMTSSLPYREEFFRVGFLKNSKKRGGGAMKNIVNILSAVRATPKEIKSETRKKFKIILAGSPEFVSAFYETEKSGFHADFPGAEPESQMNEYITILRENFVNEAGKRLQADAVIFFLCKGDANEGNLLTFRVASIDQECHHVFLSRSLLPWVKRR